VSPFRPRRSLFWSVAGLFLLITVLGTLAQAFLISAVLRPLETREAKASAEVVAADLASRLSASRTVPTGFALDTLLDGARTRLGFRPSWIVVRDASGQETTSPPPRPGRPTPRPGAIEPGPTLPGSGRDEPRVELLARRPFGTESARGEVQVLRGVRPRSVLSFFRSRNSLLLLPVSVLASVVAGLVVVRLLVRRLRAIEIFSRRAAEGDLSVRIADRSGDEIGRIAERLDHMTERLGEARDALEANDRQRRQLFADITHELATPLTSIRGYAETLLNPDIAVSDAERTRFVQGMLEESRRLERMSRDLFELARLEAGAAPLERQPLDWMALCRNTTQRFERRFQQAGLRLEWHGAPSEAWVEADGHRLEQVLENLMTNTLRYVPSGGKVELSLDAPDDAHWRLTVSDDGPGVPAETLPFVFDRFYRADERASSHGRDDNGSGLGLAIVREIVQRHGGSVRAEARVPHGLTIVVELPARPRAGLKLA
jgi:signal transduction histidine kinase